MLPTSQLPETARNSVRELHKPPRRYRLRPPGESLQTTRSKSQLARVTTQYSTNPFTLVTNYDQLKKACSILERSRSRWP